MGAYFFKVHNAAWMKSWTEALFAHSVSNCQLSDPAIILENHAFLCRKTFSDASFALTPPFQSISRFSDSRPSVCFIRLVKHCSGTLPGVFSDIGSSLTAMYQTVTLKQSSPRSARCRNAGYHDADPIPTVLSEPSATPR